jgi:ankyrin repeat protein
VIKFYQADLFARLDTLLERKEYSLSNESLQTQPAETNILRALHRDVNQRSGSDGSTYLTRAVKKGRKIEVEELILKEDADVNYTDKEGRTPLLHAVMEGDGGMVDVLTNYGAKLDATHNSRPILQEAIERGSASIVSQLRKLGAKLDEPTMNGMRPLLYIIQRNPRVSAEVLKAFCCRGEDDAALPPPEMNVVDEKGLTAVHHAVLCGNEEAIEILLSNGADPNIGCEKGNTPLHSAVIQRNETALKKLLQHCNDANESSRVNVNAEDVCRRTPLVFSVRDKGFKFAKLLLEAGANVDKCIPLINDWNGLSPPMTKILKQYRRNSMPPSPSNGDSASIISSTSLVFTRNSTPPTVATVETSSLSSHFPGLRLRRRETR